MNLVDLPLTNKQLSKLANGQNIQMSAKKLRSIGEVPGTDITVTEELFNKVNRASERNKGVRITVSDVISQIPRPQRKSRGDIGERMAKVRAKRRPKLITNDDESMEEVNGNGFNFKNLSRDVRNVSGFGFRSDLNRLGRNIGNRTNSGLKKVENGINTAHSTVVRATNPIINRTVSDINSAAHYMGTGYVGGSTFKSRQNRRFNSTMKDIKSVADKFIPEAARSKIFDAGLKTVSAIAINAAKSKGGAIHHPNGLRHQLRQNVRQNNYSPNASEIPRPLLNSELQRMNVGMYPNRSRSLGGSFRVP